MNMFFDALTAIHSDWIQVVDPRSKWTLDNVEVIKDKGVNAGQVHPHCVKCVVVNQCWFKNEAGKKPEPFGYSNFANIVLNKLKGIFGLYHPRCHCQEIPIVPPTNKTLKAICDIGKIDDMFSRKNGLTRAWGYTDQDKTLLQTFLVQSVTETYLKGNYRIFKYDEFGFRISITVSVPGVNEKAGKEYKFVTGFIVYPNGRIENTTVFGGKVK